MDSLDADIAKPNAEEDDPDQECKVYVGQLTPQANETDLQSFFRPFGVIRHIWIARKPPGFAFITYSKAEAAQRAIGAVHNMENPSILGQTIRCHLSKQGNENVEVQISSQIVQKKRVRKRNGETFKQKKERKLRALGTPSKG